VPPNTKVVIFAPDSYRPCQVLTTGPEPLRSPPTGLDDWR